MQQNSLVWILQKVLQIRHGLTPFSPSEREAVKINVRWNPVPFSSTTTTSRLKYFMSNEKATKISPLDFRHSVFHGCKFWDWNKFLSSPVFEEYVGIYEPKAPSFRVFDPQNLTFALEASLLGQMFIFRTISQPRTLSADIPAAWRDLFTKYFVEFRLGARAWNTWRVTPSIACALEMRSSNGRERP